MCRHPVSLRPQQKVKQPAGTHPTKEVNPRTPFALQKTTKHPQGPLLYAAANLKTHTVEQTTRNPSLNHNVTCSQVSVGLL